MVKPPFIVLDGYHDRDREGRDYLKDGAAGFERTQPYQYIIPYWRFILADNRQMIGSDCAHFEMQYMKCMEAFGARLGRQYCDLEQRDLEECVSNEKKRKRFHAMRDIRFKQWLLRGDRKTMYEPIDPYLRDVKPDTAGMTNKPVATPKSEQKETLTMSIWSKMGF